MLLRNQTRPSDSRQTTLRSLGLGVAAGLVTTAGARDDFPYGVPQLMTGFTEDGQLRESLIEARDRRLGRSTRQRRRDRADIPTPEVDPGANAWQSGRTVQVRLQELTLQR